MGNGKAQALITGASSGIGAEFARQLAAKGYDLILVARRRDRLEKTAESLTVQYPINVEVFPTDLSVQTDIELLERRISELENLEVLVNNAGFGVPGAFVETDIDAILTMVNVHVIATVRLTRSALPGMILRGKGFIIQVSSTSAFSSSTGSPTYGATKAYINSFTDGLVTELYGSGVHVQALCPGFTHTEFHDLPEYEKFKIKQRIPKIMWMRADQVVRGSLHAIQRGSGIYVPGFGNKLIAIIGSLGLTRLLINLYLAIFRKGPMAS